MNKRGVWITVYLDVKKIIKITKGVGAFTYCYVIMHNKHVGKISEKLISMQHAYLAPNCRLIFTIQWDQIICVNLLTYLSKKTKWISRNAVGKARGQKC